MTKIDQPAPVLEFWRFYGLKVRKSGEKLLDMGFMRNDEEKQEEAPEPG